MGGYFDGGWAPYVSVAERRRKAERLLAALRKKGRVCLPVAIEGRAIARTFWGKNWCDNLEAYSDYENRLPRGRSYVRNGSVIDLQIGSKNIAALVSGSSIYEVSIGIEPLAPTLWRAVRDECAGKVASLVELLQGKLSSAVMEVVTRRGGGLFPAPKQIKFRCSCPDGAFMCKHVAAVLYGVGARLDSQPELLFQLRDVDPDALIRQAGSMPAAPAGIVPGLDGVDLSALFGIELEEPAWTMPPANQAVAVPATSAANVPTPTAAQRRLGKTITSKELGERGIPVHMRQNWLTSGVLVRTGQRGVYGVTPQTAKRIARYLARDS